MRHIDKTVCTDALTTETEAAAAATDSAFDAATTDPAERRLAKRGTCATQPAGASGAPTVSVDSPSAFVSNAAFASVASAAPVPTGYNQAFVNLDASNK